MFQPKGLELYPFFQILYDFSWVTGVGGLGNSSELGLIQRFGVSEVSGFRRFEGFGLRVEGLGFAGFRVFWVSG